MMKKCFLLIAVLVAALPSHSNDGAIWGSVYTRELDGDGDADAVDWSGDISGLHLGVDFYLGDNLIGFAVSQSDADLDYKTTAAQGAVTEGEYEISLTALHPSINRKFGNVDYWANIDLGSGEITVTDTGGNEIKSDLALTAIGGGVGVQIVPSLQLRVEAQTIDTEIEGNDDRTILQQNLNTNSVRAMARWQNYLARILPLDTANQAAFFEAGMRRDGGDGENRRDTMEAALGWNYYGQHTEIESTVLGLFGRKDYREWGAYTNVWFSGGDDGQGLSLHIRPSYGESRNEFRRVWNAESSDDIVDINSDSTAYKWRAKTRLSYGIQRAGGLVTLFVEVAAAENNTYRMGFDYLPRKRIGTRRPANRANNSH